VIVFGRTFNPSRYGKSIHRRETRTYPTRYVVIGPTGWNLCENCGREHRVWITDDRTWAKLWPAWRGMRLCAGCFRERRLLSRRG
jgi:hypothetical protein